MNTFHKTIRSSVILIALLFSFFSCKLHSLIPDSEFIQYDNLIARINGTYTINQEVKDSLSRFRNEFLISDIVRDKDRKLLKDKYIESLTLSYDGKEEITFSLFDGNESLNFTYKCEAKDNYIEIYFTKRRIWALPLFLNYEYDRLRLGLDENTNLIVHKWHTILATLTLIGLDSFGHNDYSHTLTRLSP